MLVFRRGKLCTLTLFILWSLRAAATLKNISFAVFEAICRNKNMLKWTLEPVKWTPLNLKKRFLFGQNMHFFRFHVWFKRILIMLGGKLFPWPRTIQTAMYCSSQFLLENTSTPQLLPLPEFFQFKFHLDPPPGCNRHRQEDIFWACKSQPNPSFCHCYWVRGRSQNITFVLLFACFVVSFQILYKTASITLARPKKSIPPKKKIRAGTLTASYLRAWKSLGFARRQRKGWWMRSELGSCMLR